MPNITVGRYKVPDKVGYSGWTEPDSKSWIVFIDVDGNPFFHLRNEDGSVKE